MSEPIQSISQGNYILATQQEVSHDNTLSGNGTSASPLGLNETVLWEGDASPVNGTVSGTYSEPLTNFERIRITWQNNDNGSFKHAEYPASQTLSYMSDISPNGQWWKGITVDTNSTAFSNIKCYELTLGSPATGTSVNYFHLLKVVGVNRK